MRNARRKNPSASSSVSADMDEMDATPGFTPDFFDAVDHLTDRKMLLKRESFRSVISSLQRSFSPELLETHVETIISSCLSIIKKNRSSPEEVLLALDALKMLAITLGEEGTTLLSEARDEICNLFTPVHASEVRCASLETRSLLEFVCSFDHVDPDDTLDELALVFNQEEEEDDVKEAALDAFALVVSMMDSQHVATDVAQLFMEDISEQLHNPALGIQLSAGALLALITEARLEHVNAEDDDLYNVVFSVTSRVEELSHENTKSLSKKSKAKIRSSFRDILSTVDAGESPYEKLHFGREKLVCTSWPAVVHLQRMRNMLSTGLNSHLKHNGLLRSIFSKSIHDKGEKLVGRDKRLLQSRNSIVEKQRSLQFHHERGVLREGSLFEEGPSS